MHWAKAARFAHFSSPPNAKSHFAINARHSTAWRITRTLTPFLSKMQYRSTPDYTYVWYQWRMQREKLQFDESGQFQNRFCSCYLSRCSGWWPKGWLNFKKNFIFNVFFPLWKYILVWEDKSYRILEWIFSTVILIVNCKYTISVTIHWYTERIILLKH